MIRRGKVIAAISAATIMLAGCGFPLPPGGGGGGSGAPKIDGCPVFPADNAWNTDISTKPVRPDSAAFVQSINAAGKTMLHPDFGGHGAYGIPFIRVEANEQPRPINYTAYGDESDPGPFPIPPTAPVEGAPDPDGDRHVIVVQKGTCHLFELYRSFWKGDHWDADSGTNWDLRSNALRQEGWTSADAAGLPILPGLARYDEVAAGAINHALRFTVKTSQRGYILPATHYASSSSNPTLPPMGLRMRLRGGLRHLGVPRTSEGDPRRAEALRDDRGRQRQQLVHHR